MNKLIVKLLSSITTCLITAVLLSSVSLAVTGGIGGRPAAPDSKVPRTNDIFIYTLKSNDTKKDAVLISNNTDTKQTIEFYATDAEITNTGAFTCKQRVEPKKDVGSWIHFGKSTVTLESGTNVKVPFTVQMPQHPEPGEHNGCLAFEPKNDDGEVEGNVRIRTRSAVRVAITVPGQLNRNVDITSFDVTATANGQQQFSLSIKNTGNVSADTKTFVELKTLFGMSVYQNEGTYPVIAGNKYDVNYTNDKKPFWGGWYKASASISYDEKAGSFGLAESSKLTKKDSNVEMIFVEPEPAAVAVYSAVIILIVISVLYLMYRRHEKREALLNWEHHIVQDGETVQTLSQGYNISWKKIAKINNLKAPYILEPGSTLQLPKKK